jgi:hypothetical protein
MISAHSAREIAARDIGESKKKEKEKREWGGKPKQPRARVKAKK